MADDKLNLGKNDSKSDGKREDKPFRVRRTGTGSNKVLFESNDERVVKEFVQNNYPRPHHEAEDHDVYLESPTGAKTAYTAGAGDDGWADYKTPREREDG
jgi:hypothetical protein